MLYSIKSGSGYHEMCPMLILLLSHLLIDVVALLLDLDGIGALTEVSLL